MAVYCPICEKKGRKSILCDFPDEPFDWYCGYCDAWVNRKDLSITYKRWEDYGRI